MSDNRMDRRQLLGRGAALAGLAALSTEALFAAEASAGYAATSAYKGTLRVVGLGVDLIPADQEGVREDAPRHQAAVHRQGHAGHRPDRPHAAEDAGHHVRLLPPARPGVAVGQPHPDPRREGHRRSTSISRLIKHGALKPGVPPGQGDAPFRKIFLDSSKKKFATGATKWLTMIPGNHNSDSFGYNEKEVGGKLDSWASLFDSHFKGHVALISDPDIGFIDAGMAAKASGKMTMKDLGNPTKKEIDDLTTILKDLKKAGHFKAFWSTFQESVHVHADRRGRRRVDVVAGRDAAAGSAVPGALRGAQGRLPRLGRRQRHPHPRHGRQARRGVRLPELVEHAGARGNHGDAGLLQRQHLGGPRGPRHEQRPSAAPPPTTTGSRARRPRSRSSAPTASRASRSAPSATAAPTRPRSGRFYAWNSQGVNRDYLLQKWQEFITA